MIGNIHYFKTSEIVIKVFTDIKNRLNIEEIYTIIEQFDFIPVGRILFRANWLLTK